MQYLPVRRPFVHYGPRLPVSHVWLVRLREKQRGSGKRGDFIFGSVFTYTYKNMCMQKNIKPRRKGETFCIDAYNLRENWILWEHKDGLEFTMEELGTPSLSIIYWNIEILPEEKHLEANLMLTILSHTFLQICANLLIVCVHGCLGTEQQRHCPLRMRDPPPKLQIGYYSIISVCLRLNHDFRRNHCLPWK